MFTQHDQYSTKQNATFEQRIIAFVIDATLFGTLSSLLKTVGVNGGSLSFLYFTLFQIYLGFTPGKFLVGLRVISTTGQGSFLKMIFRETFGKTISILFFCGGYFAIMFRGDRLAWHDRLSSTRVVTLKPQNLSGLGQFARGLVSIVLIGVLFVSATFYQILFTPYIAEKVAAKIEAEGFQVRGTSGNLNSGYNFKEISKDGKKGKFQFNNVKFKLSPDLFQLAKTTKKEGQLVFESMSIEGGNIQIKGDESIESIGLAGVLSGVMGSKLKSSPSTMNRRASGSNETLSVVIKSIEINNIEVQGPSSKVKIDRISLGEFQAKTNDYSLIKHIYVSSDLIDVYIKDYVSSKIQDKVSLNLTGTLKSTHPLFRFLKKSIHFKGSYKSNEDEKEYQLSAFGEKLTYQLKNKRSEFEIKNLNIKKLFRTKSPFSTFNISVLNGTMMGDVKMRNKLLRIPPQRLAQLLRKPLRGSMNAMSDIEIQWWNFVRDKPWLYYAPTKEPISSEVLAFLYLKKGFSDLKPKYKKTIKKDLHFFSRGPFADFWNRTIKRKGLGDKARVPANQPDFN